VNILNYFLASIPFVVVPTISRMSTAISLRELSIKSTFVLAEESLKVELGNFEKRNMKTEGKKSTNNG